MIELVWHLNLKRAAFDATAAGYTGSHIYLNPPEAYLVKQGIKGPEGAGGLAKGPEGED